MQVTLELSDTDQSVIALKQHHRLTWRERGQLRWMLGLLKEIVELLLSLYGLHEGPPDWELQQIAAIAMNWLEMRAAGLASDNQATQKE